MSDQTIEALGVNEGVDPSEPSMEDILASIRRIIADDGDNTADLKNAVEMNPEPHVNVGDFAAISPETRDQNTVLVEAETGVDVDELNLEDILVLSDDDFSAVDLEIPMMTAPSDDMTDDLLIEVDDVLAAEFEDILAEDDGEKSSSMFSDVDLIMSDSDALASHDMNVDLVMPDSEVPPNVLAELESNLELDHEINFVLGGEGDSDFFVPPQPGDHSDILDMVEAGIADIEGRASAGVSEAFTDFSSGDDTGFTGVDNLMPTPQLEDITQPPMQSDDDGFIDLVGNLLADAEVYAPIGDNSIFAEIEAEPLQGDIPAELPAVETLPSEEDLELDLVKSLMADLTDDSLIDDDIFGDEPIAEAPAAPDAVVDPVMVADDDELGLVDDILDLAIADEVALSEEASAQNERIATAENDQILTDVSPAETGILTIEEIMADPHLGVSEELDNVDDDDEAVESVDASINSLLGIAALAERDALSVQDDLTARLADAANEVSLSDDEDARLDAEINAATTADVDMALTPEVETEYDAMAAIFAGGDVANAGDADLDEDAANEALLPESFDAQVKSADDLDLPNSIFDAPDATDDLSLADDVFNTPIFEGAFDDYEDILPAADVFPSEDILPSDVDLTGDDTSTDEIALPPTPEQEPTEMPKLVAKDGIIDDVTETAAFEAFASLNQVVEENTVFQESGPRIGDLVQAALKPMLKEWLDENLKGIVERAVTKEVKRISAGK